jgi:hypothetical protein
VVEDVSDVTVNVATQFGVCIPCPIPQMDAKDVLSPQEESMVKFMGHIHKEIGNSLKGVPQARLTASFVASHVIASAAQNKNYGSYLISPNQFCKISLLDPERM